MVHEQIIEELLDDIERIENMSWAELWKELQRDLDC